MLGAAKHDDQIIFNLETQAEPLTHPDKKNEIPFVELFDEFLLAPDLRKDLRQAKAAQKVDEAAKAKAAIDKAFRL